MADYRIKDLPESERPRERLEALGPGALSNAELLAIILRTGTSSSTAVELAGSLLARYGSLRELASAQVPGIADTKGIGPAKACQIAAAFELGRRSAAQLDGRRPRISGPQDVDTLLRPRLDGLKQENFIVLMMNAKNELMKMETVTRGTLTASLIHPRETFRAAISEGCHSVILVHNHPTGDPEPSGEDIKITRKMVESGDLLGIKVLDHIIIGRDAFSSMKDMGIIS